ncbi:MarR family winged helix-turn-helix transcriptional regulator [Pseudarthrobacter sp. P1]|uniref:MarR family winged helix-turn-helix transcriptional regulator n=1 Tax=Pseudarthrobacter sp. P1 TaxID=3418418 RepID=UPI003CED8507
MRTSRRLRAEASSETLSPGQYSVLAAVARGPMTLRALAERENISAPSMTRIVNSLEASGFVERVAHPTDGRQVLVWIADAGTAAHSAARTKRTEWLAKRVAKLSSEDRAVLRRAAAILAEMSAK